MKEVGRIIHTDSQVSPAAANEALLDEAHAIGRRLVQG
jgi:hypothetical protein